ncbi:hypothetical protein, partial [Streptococcus suis]|uniref:hypothetical protein n=1 Tax=Streptococcus suis TaxID=1307 RepID=UPI0021BC0339
NFKHSTGLFELALPDFAKATCSASFISHLTQYINCASNLGDTNSPVDYSYLSLKTKKRSTSAGHLETRKN